MSGSPPLKSGFLSQVSHVRFPASGFPYLISGFPYQVFHLPSQVSRLSFPISPSQVSHLLSKVFHVRFTISHPKSGFPPQVSHPALRFPISHIRFPASGYPSHHLKFPICCPRFSMSGLPSPKSGFPNHVSHLRFPISNLRFPISQVSHLPSQVSRLRFPISPSQVSHLRSKVFHVRFGNRCQVLQPGQACIAIANLPLLLVGDAFCSLDCSRWITWREFGMIFVGVGLHPPRLSICGQKNATLVTGTTVPDMET